MDYLSPEQSNFLKRLDTNEIKASNLSETDLEIAKYLEKQKYVKLNMKQKVVSSDSVTSFQKELISVSITQNGKAYLRNEDIALKEHNAAISQARTAKTTAIVSIVISVISLLCSFISLFI